MPKFLDEIKFIDSTGTPRTVSDYVPKINVQGQYYTGINEDEDDTSVDDGEISKQGKYFTGKNANGQGNEQDGEIYEQGSAWKEDIISTGSAWKEDIISTGEQYTSGDGKIAQAQADAIAAINAKGEQWAGDLDVDDIVASINTLRNTKVDKVTNVNFVARSSDQTSEISNGRLKTRDKDDDVGIDKIGQIEPMGFTALYNTGLTDDNNKEVKQQTTVCINPNEINSIGKTKSAIVKVGKNIIFQGAYGVTISLALMGYSNIIPESFAITDPNGFRSVYDFNEYLYNDPNPDTNPNHLPAFDDLGSPQLRVNFLNGLIFIDDANLQILLDTYPSTDVYATVEFDYVQNENYLYLPGDTGTIALKENVYNKIIDEPSGEELVTIARSQAGDNFIQSTQGKTRIDNQLIRVDFTWDDSHDEHVGQNQSHRMFSDYEYYRLTTGDEDTIDESGEVDKVNGRKLVFNTLIWPALTGFSAVQNDYKKNKTDYNLVTNPNDSNYNKYLKQINIRYPSKGGTLALAEDNAWAPGSRAGSTILGSGLATPPKATASYALAMGNNSTASGNYSFAHGYMTKVTTQHSAAFNYKSEATGTYTFAANNGKATANLSAAFGKATADAEFQFAVGNFTKPNTNALFKVGNNKSTNAFEVLTDGRATVQAAPINNTDVVRKLELATKLNKVTSGNGIIYATDANNQFEAIPWYVSNPKANSIPRRDANGRLMAADAGTGGYDVVNNNTILRGKGVDYNYRDSNQTSTISNGRLQTRDIDDDVTKISKQSQIEPMGLTVMYNTNIADSYNKIRQQTTMCINPNEVENIYNTRRSVVDVSKNIIFKGDMTLNISLALLGYENIKFGTVTIKTIDGETRDDELNPLSDAFRSRNLVVRIDYQNAIIYLDGEFEQASGISKEEFVNYYLSNDNKIEISFEYTSSINYVYIPQKTGTIALKEDFMIPGVSYNYRENSNQTTSIENGRVTCENQYGLLGQIEPMGMTIVRYANGHGKGSGDEIYQKTTICANSSNVDSLDSVVDTELYIPQKTGTIATLSDIPTFEIIGDNLYITLNK